MFRSAIAALVVVMISYTIFQQPASQSVALPPCDAQSSQMVSLPVVVPQKFEMVVPADCPDGKCPLQPKASQVVVSSAHSRGQWSYPGDIQSHMASTHGVNVSGMSLQQAETLHSQLHQQNVTYARTTSTVRYTRAAPARRVVTAPVRFIVNRQPVRSVLRRVFCR
jgi:hypothetical protein